MTSLRNVALLAGILGLGLTACGGGGGPAASGRPTAALPTLSAPAPTTSSAPEPSTSRPPRPSVTLPTRSAAVTPPPNPATPAPTTPAPKPTPAPTPTRTAAPPTQTSVPEPTQTSTPTPAPSPTGASTPSPTSTAAATAVSSSSTSPWVWWLLGLLLAAAVVTLVVVVVRRRRARRDREARLAGVVAESTWLARNLLPNALSTQGASARRDVWTAYRPRVGVLQNNLNDLMASVPTERLGSLDRLRAAVNDISSAMDSYAATDGPADRERLGAARQAQRQLEAALRAFQPPPPGPQGTR